MSNNWKKQLKLFLKSNDEKELKVFLRQNWVDLFPEAKDDIYLFLYQMKLNKLFLYLMAIDLKNHIAEMPWLLFLKIIEDDKITIPPDIYEELNELLFKAKRSDAISHRLSETISSLKQQYRYHFLQNLTKKKQELLASAQIAKSERLMDQYIHYMNELKKFSPYEYNITGLITDQEKNKAEGILKKRMRTRSTSPESLQFNPQEIEFIESIKQQSLQYFQKGNARATDFAFLLRSLGENELSIDFVQRADEGNQKDWQLLDYLFYAKQHLSVLSHCSILKNKYASQPDSLFSIFYTEALSYWELGEREKALDLMTQISTMRPDFKSATEILTHWKEEPFE